MNTDITDKRSLRRYMKGLRTERVKAMPADTAKRLRDHVLSLEELEGKNTFFVYRSFGCEAPTGELVEELLKRGKTVCLPRIENSDMVPICYQEGAPMSVNQWGIEEPLGKVFTGEIEVAIMPLVAVTVCGERVGYGGGYYDRFFAERRILKVGFCYDFQIVDEAFAEPHDVKLDLIVTEEKIVRTGEEA